MIIQKLCIPFPHQEHKHSTIHRCRRENVIQGLVTRGPYSNIQEPKMKRYKIK